MSDAPVLPAVYGDIATIALNRPSARAAGRVPDLLVAKLDESLEGQLERETCAITAAITASGLAPERRERAAALLVRRHPDLAGVTKA